VTSLAPLLARWNELPKAIRLGMAVAVACVAVVAIVGGMLSHPARTPLFAAALHPEQLAEVEERLAGWNVPFVPASDNVIVENSRRNDLLLRLSLAGVPHAHLETTGEALAGVGVLTPQAVIDAQARSGLAGDIEAGLRGIEGIDDARVIVAPAKVAEFADQSARDASASVRLRMREGARLSAATVSGVRAFVAASVAGLDPGRVTILDDRGVALGEGDSEPGAADSQRELQSALDSAFGTGATIVRIHAEYRGAAVAERDERRVPLGDRAIVQTATNESYDGDGKRYRRVDQRDDRGSDTRETVSQSAPGALLRLSTAVYVDRARAAELAQVRELAAATVGYDPKRGDTLAVEAVDFHREAPVQRDVWWLLYGAFVPLVPTLALVAGLIVVARVAVPPLASTVQGFLERAAVERTSKAVAGFAPARVRSALANEPPHAAAAIISALPAATAAAVLDLYPQHEREAIVRRMVRVHSPLLSDAEELLRKHV
jgi:flagellar M-ring protein FliF